eukprot:Gb_16389 [translate_table: standard]
MWSITLTGLPLAKQNDHRSPTTFKTCSTPHLAIRCSRLFEDIFQSPNITTRAPLNLNLRSCTTPKTLLKQSNNELHWHLHENTNQLEAFLLLIKTNNQAVLKKARVPPPVKPPTQCWKRFVEQLPGAIEWTLTCWSMNMVDSNCANDKEQGKQRYQERVEDHLKSKIPWSKLELRAQKLRSSRSRLSKNKKELPEHNADRYLEESSAIKIQATIKAYLAWRAFSVLKGVIRLQAHVSGRLVRKQAAGTLSCVQAIVRLQALVHRARRLIFSEQGLIIQKKLERIRQQNGSKESKLGTKSPDVSVNNGTFLATKLGELCFIFQCNAIVRTLPSVETLGCTTVICSNKTGTLTSNMMSVSKICVIHSVHLGPVSTQYTGNTYAPEGVVFDPGGVQLEHPANFPSLLHIAMCSALCNDSTSQYNLDKRTYEKIGESTEVALCTAKKGAPESIVAQCTNVLCNDDNSAVPLTSDVQAELEETFHSFGQKETLRCFTFAWKQDANRTANIEFGEMFSKC